MHIIYIYLARDVWPTSGDPLHTYGGAYSSFTARVKPNMGHKGAL